MAIDRKAYINTLYSGYAMLPRTLANPGTWGYERDVFQKDWNSLPEPTQNVAKAKQLVQQAGATGKTIVIGTTQRDQPAADRRQRRPPGGAQHRPEGEVQVGLGGQLHQLLHRPLGAQGRRRLPQPQLPRLRRPRRALQAVRRQGGSPNYDDFEDRRITAALEGARTTPDQRKRAELTAKAGDLIMQTLPWIPLADPDTIVIMDKKITGAPSSFQYMGGPWAATIGANG